MMSRSLCLGINPPFECHGNHLQIIWLIKNLKISLTTQEKIYFSYLEGIPTLALPVRLIPPGGFM